MTKLKHCEDGYLMSQSQAGTLLGVNQRTISKAEKSALIKLKAMAIEHAMSYDELATIFKHYLREY